MIKVWLVCSICNMWLLHTFLVWLCFEHIILFQSKIDGSGQFVWNTFNPITPVRLRWSTKCNCTKSMMLVARIAWFMCLTINYLFNNLTARILTYVRICISILDCAVSTSSSFFRRWTITNTCSVLLSNNLAIDSLL